MYAFVPVLTFALEITFLFSIHYKLTQSPLGQGQD